jgi:hypothetical protein
VVYFGVVGSLRKRYISLSMRILRFFLTALLLTVVVSLVTFLVAREVLLQWGSSAVSNSLMQLREAKRQNTYDPVCLQEGSINDGDEDIVTLQMRFTSSTNYVLEALCSGFSFAPIEHDSVDLPAFVSKMPGTTGFVFDQEEPHSITLQAFASELEQLGRTLDVDLSSFVRKKTLVFNGYNLVTAGTIGDMGLGPQTSCEGYGFYCCQFESELGVGDQIQGLGDCEKTCYSRCERRPVVLSFNTNPYVELETRTVRVQTGELVEFAYTADDLQNDSLVAQLDFGDGEGQTLLGTTNRTSYAYSCNRPTCSYTARLELTNKQGVTSAPTRTSEINVVVNSQ